MENKLYKDTRIENAIMGLWASFLICCAQFYILVSSQSKNFQKNVFVDIFLFSCKKMPENKRSGNQLKCFRVELNKKFFWTCNLASIK